jgi:hypothetical protein
MQRCSHNILILCRYSVTLPAYAVEELRRLKRQQAEELLALGVRQSDARILEKANERMKARKAKAQEPVSLSITLPLLRAAADESRDDLQDLWARLLAAAADPSRTRSFRLAFIDAAKKMDPLDAGVLQAIHGQRGGASDATERIGVACQPDRYATLRRAKITN